MPSPHQTDADGLSEREAEVLRLIALGYANKDIAARMTLSIMTVETYKKRALKKLGIKTRVVIVRYATRRSWLTGE
jgi:two-component system response regulator NreC